MTEKLTVAVNGANLATYLDGDADKPWIVVSNSLACTYESWFKQLDMLTRRFRVLRYDTRGHGASSAPAGPYSFDLLVGDVVGLMDHYGIDRADYLGLSMGAMTGLGLAVEHPSRIGRLVCCDARSDAVPPFIDSWNQRIAAIQAAGGMSGVLDFTLERWFTADFRTAEPATLELAKKMILSTNPDGYIACAEALKKLDYKRRLGEIGAPALFVAGAQDMAAPAAVMQEMASLTKGAAFEQVNPGAHICTLENSTEFNRIVGTWLGVE